MNLLLVGGTNVLHPIHKILSTPAKKGVSRQIFLLSDGEVINEQECIRAVKQHSHTTRVFTFGVGTDASKALLKGMARAGDGNFESIIENRNMDEKVIRQLNLALKPSLTNVFQVEKKTNDIVEVRVAGGTSS